MTPSKQGFSLLVVASLILLCCKTTPTAPEIPKPQPVATTPAPANIAKKPVVKTVDTSHLQQGHRFAQDGLYREAIREYQLFLHQNANHPEALRALGIIFVKTGQYTEAIKNLELARKTFINDFETNYYLGESYRTQDRYDDAIFHYRVALKQQPNHVQTMKALAWSYFQIRFYRAAHDVARELKKIAPNDIQVDIIFARVLNHMGRSQQALTMIRRSIALANPLELPFLRSVLGDLLLSSGDCNQAEVVYREALKDQPLLAGALLGLAKCMISRGQQVELARDFVERALRLKPKMTEAYYWLARSYESQEPEKAARYYAIFQTRAAGDPAFREQIEISRKKVSQFRGQETVKLPTEKRRDTIF